VHLDAADRRRIAFASIITMAALPALWLFSTDRAAEQGAGVAALGVDGGLPAAAPAAEAEAPSDGFGEVDPGEPVFMAGPTVPSPQEQTVHYADPASQQSVTGSANYRRFDPGTPSTRPCQVPAAPFGATITVSNLNNGRQASCVNVSITPIAGSWIAVLDTEVFLEIADLVDAPLPVTLTW
jgi:hypothetical protein